MIKLTEINVLYFYCLMALFYMCSVGDQLLLDDSDVCHVGASQFQPIYLSSQLHSTHTQSSVVSVLMNNNAQVNL